MQLQELVKMVRTLESIQHERLDVNLSYKIMKFMKSAKDDVEFYEKTAKAIIEDNALRDENGNVIHDNNGGIQMNVKAQADIEKQIEELNTKEVEEPTIRFNIKDFRGLRLSVVDLMNLDKILIEEE